jgi:type I restriction enzyme S subunit
MTEWRSTRLGEVTDLRSGFAFKSSQWKEDGVPVVKIGNVKHGQLDLSGCSYVSSVDAEASRFLLQKNDILIGLTGHVGSVCRVRTTGPIALNQRVGVFRPSREKIDANFLYHLVYSTTFKERVVGAAYGSAQPNVSPRQILDFEVALPSMQEQRGIAATLGALDDKIEVNRRMAATLEEMARALYRSWFVDFDPVTARAQGRAPAHMGETTAALFPARLTDAGLPEGWEMATVGDAFDVTMGQSPPGDTYNDDGVGLPFFQGRTDFGFRYPENRKFCSAPSRIAEPESTLLSVRAPVGDLNRAWERCCVGRGVAALSEKGGRAAYGYMAMWSLSEALLAYDTEGTVFGAINKKQLLALPVVRPPEALVDAYEDVVGPMDRRIRNLTDENRTLAALRDALLPKLMSGELRVREAEARVAEAV